MSLENRAFGFEFSSIEKELLFNRKNTGFVKIDNRSKIIFRLSASPFLENKKNEVFVAQNCPMPPDGVLVEVSVAHKEEVLQGGVNNLSKIIIKYIDSWKEIDSSNFAKKSDLIKPQEFIDFFSRQYRRRFGMIEEIAECSALCALSSPQLFYDKGGLNASVLSKTKQWDGFYRTMTFIPKEFRKASSRNQYQISKGEKLLSSNESIEISCFFHAPKETHVHIAIPYEPKIQAKKYEWYKDEASLMRGFLISSLLIEPEIPDKLEKKVTDAVYAINWEYKKRKEASYKQDLGSAVPRLCRSIARLERVDKVDNNNVDEIVALWTDMHKNALRFGHTTSLNQKITDLSDRAKILFVKLENQYGFDTFFDIEEGKKLVKFSNIDFDDLLEELKMKGYIYYSNKGRFKLIDIQN